MADFFLFVWIKCSCKRGEYAYLIIQVSGIPILCALKFSTVKNLLIQGIPNPIDIPLTALNVYQCADFEPVIKADFNFHDGVIDIEFDLEEDFTDIYQVSFKYTRCFYHPTSLLMAYSH